MEALAIIPCAVISSIKNNLGFTAGQLAERGGFAECVAVLDRGLPAPARLDPQ